FDVEPDAAALDLVGVRTLVQAPLAAHLVLEVLDGIGDEGIRPLDPRFRQRPVENPPGGADERLAGKVFLVAGLLADQHHMGVPVSFPGHGLGRMLIERAARADILGPGKLWQRPDGRRIELELALSIMLSRHGSSSVPCPPPCLINARRSLGFGNQAPWLAEWDIKKSLCLYCRPRRALL